MKMPLSPEKEEEKAAVLRKAKPHFSGITKCETAIYGKLVSGIRQQGLDAELRSTADVEQRARILGRLRVMKADLEETKSTLKEVTAELYALDPKGNMTRTRPGETTKVYNYDDNLEFDSNRIADLFDTINMALVSPSPQPVTSPAPPVPKVCKPVSDLKPDTLYTTTSRVGFNTWKRSYKAYFDASGMGNVSVGTQQSFLFSCLDTNVSTRLEAVITHEVTPVFATSGDSCMAMLDKIWDELYPLFNLRLDFQACKQTKDEQFSSFINRLWEQFRVAKMSNKECSDKTRLMVHAIEACSDRALQKKLTEVAAAESFDYDKLIEAIQVYETSSTMNARLANVPQVCQVAQKSSPNEKLANGTRAAMNDLHQQGRCTSCGEVGHISRNCIFVIDRIRCNNCDKIGHSYKVCYTPTLPRSRREERSPSPPPRVRMVEPSNSYSSGDSGSLPSIRDRPPTPVMTIGPTSQLVFPPNYVYGVNHESDCSSRQSSVLPSVMLQQPEFLPDKQQQDEIAVGQDNGETSETFYLEGLFDSMSVESGVFSTTPAERCQGQSFPSSDIMPAVECKMSHVKPKTHSTSGHFTPALQISQNNSMLCSGYCESLSQQKDHEWPPSDDPD